MRLTKAADQTRISPEFSGFTICPIIPVPAGDDTALWHSDLKVQYSDNSKPNILLILYHPRHFAVLTTCRSKLRTPFVNFRFLASIPLGNRDRKYGLA